MIAIIILGTATAAIILTILFISIFFLVNCKKCGTHKPIYEIVRLGKGRELKGEYCYKCKELAEKEKAQVDISYNSIFSEKTTKKSKK